VKAIISWRESVSPQIYALYASASLPPSSAPPPVVRVLGGPGSPVTRPLYYEFGRSDPRTLCDARAPPSPDPHLAHLASCDYLLGPALLCCPVYRPGAGGRDCYLPAGADWVDVTSPPASPAGGGVLVTDSSAAAGGTVVRVSNTAEDGRPVVFARAGAGTQVAVRDERSRARVAVVMVLDGGGAAEWVLYDDDEGGDGAGGGGGWVRVAVRGRTCEVENLGGAGGWVVDVHVFAEEEGFLGQTSFEVPP
jgi:hypothetical protein